MSDYPILVEKFTDDQAYIVVCEDCGLRARLTGDEVAGEVGYRAAGGFLTCVHGCDGSMTYAYEEALRCGGCRSLGHHEKALNYCCSRACMLQAEYAASLTEGRA
jgi:hypothetical protein